MELKFIVESILFSAQKPLSAKEIRDLLKQTATQSEEEEGKAFKKVPVDKVISALEELADVIQSRIATWRAARRAAPPLALPQIKIFGLDLMGLKAKKGKGDSLKGVAASPGTLDVTGLVQRDDEVVPVVGLQGWLLGCRSQQADGLARASSTDIHMTGAPRWSRSIAGCARQMAWMLQRV